MLRVLTLSTLFPDSTRPQFGPFVERQTMGLAAHPDVDLRVMAPIGIPPLGRYHARYRALATLPEVETWKGLPVYRTRFGHIPGVGGRYDGAALTRALLRPLRGIREQFPFDVIDAEFFFPDGPAAIALGRALSVPVSIKARGSDIHVWAARGPTQRQVVAAGQAADSVLAVSAALKADMVALGMPAAKIAVHYTGIDKAIFRVRDRAAAKAALGVSGPLIVSVGALIERKGQGIVIEAMRDVPGATLALIGHGPAQADFEAAAASSGVGDRIRFLGSMPHPQIADWLAAADAMALLSVSEGLANAWVEALASGTPIVIPDVGGAREVLDRPAAGRFVERTSASVAAALKDILGAPPSRDDVAAAADKFSWEVNATQLYQHLKALVARY